MKVGHAVGLSVEPEGDGKWRLRWRQNEVQPDGTIARKQRQTVAYSPEERKQLEIEIERQLKERGFWTPATEASKVKPQECNAEAVTLKWLEWKRGLRGAKPTTILALAGALKRWFTEVRAVEGLRAEDAVLGRTFSVELISKVTARWREAGSNGKARYADGTIYQTVAAVTDLWTWAASQPEYADVVTRPPYNRAVAMPMAPLYEAPEEVPTWAEADACLRRIRKPEARAVATIMRYTGLRLEQAVQVHAEDIDKNAATLMIRKGKSRREQAGMRRVPVSPHLLVDLGPWLKEHPSGPLFPDVEARDAEGNAVPIVSYRNLSTYVTEAWKAATAAGDARREVWAPSNRTKARPDHAFRAALQHHLQEAGIGDNVIDHLVGHAPKGTRGKHYARPGDQALKRAVDLVPAVDWRERVVLPFKGRASA